MGLVFLKELKELLRDKRTLFFMIAFPILVFPLIMALTVFVSSKALEEAQSEQLEYVVIGAEFGESLLEELRDSDEFKQLNMPENQTVEALIKNQSIDFALEIPPNFVFVPGESGKSTVKLYLNDSSINFVYSRVNNIVKVIAENRQNALFDKYHMTEQQRIELLEPVVLEKVDIANERESLGEKLGGFIPYIIFILCFQSAMVVALDLGAGEKERGTLETLLISPISRTQIVLGKFLLICFASLVSAFVTVASMFTWAIVASQGLALEMVDKVAGQLNLLDVSLMFFMIIPVVAIFASGMLSLSIFAKSNREAQGYMGTVLTLVIFPLILAMLPGVTLDSGWAWVPLTNVALALKELFKGTMEYSGLFMIFISTTITAGLFISFCVYWFKQEKVLFR